ncbi:hypothetical protein D3C75_906640 [compost metagenome]
MHRYIKTRFNPLEQVRVIRERQVGIGAALHQNFRAAHIHRFLNLAEDGFIREHIALIAVYRTVERAKPAKHVADIGIVDIPADHKGGYRLRIPAFHDLVSRSPYLLHLIGLKEAYAFLHADSSFGFRFVKYPIDGHAFSPPLLIKFPIYLIIIAI